jgi:hypothetical protein
VAHVIVNAPMRYFSIQVPTRVAHVMLTTCISK